MFLEIEATRALTSLEFLLAALVGVAPIGVTLWVKLVLYRRRMAEEKEEASRLQNEREADHAKERLRRRHEAWSARFRRTSGPARPTPITRPLRFAAAHWASRNRQCE